MADQWVAKCLSCGQNYRVEAAKTAHEEDQEKRMAFRCDRGPFITHAFNLTHPKHPCAPSEW